MTIHFDPGYGKLPLAPAALVRIGGQFKPRAPDQTAVYSKGERHTAAGINATPRSTVGVLPFVNTTAEPTVDNVSAEFANGVVDAIKVGGAFEDATLCPRLQYDRENIHVCDMGRRLNVDLILIGDVHVSDGHLHASALMVYTDSGLMVRLQDCESEAQECAAIQRNLAEDLARQLKSALQLPEEHAAPSDKQYL